MTLSAFFKGYPDARKLFTVLRRQVEALGDVSVKVTKSQVAFQRSAKTFARVWLPRQYLRRGAPLVLTLGFKTRVRSRRWKEVTEAAPGRFTHHLELHQATDIDRTVMRWVGRAWRESVASGH